MGQKPGEYSIRAFLHAIIFIIDRSIVFDINYVSTIIIIMTPSAWLYGLCRGEDSEPVRVRTLPLSVGCGKNFPGKNKLTTPKQVLVLISTLGRSLRLPYYIRLFQ